VDCGRKKVNSDEVWSLRETIASVFEFIGMEDASDYRDKKMAESEMKKEAPPPKEKKRPPR